LQQEKLNDVIEKVIDIMSSVIQIYDANFNGLFKIKLAGVKVDMRS
jgi:hypothetical protein